ncbi:MAG: flagellar protein [Schwartzia sp.]|nr:flagellar protein [Schwartzia sp. (in: firmicutes)]
MADARIYWSPQPILPAGVPAPGRPADAPAAEKKPSFADILAGEESRVSFSQHALQRIQDRQIDFSRQDLTKLDDTVERMAQKGAKESLIYMNDVALIVSVANKTVITAMDGPSAKENIFTNIDSAAIL